MGGSHSVITTRPNSLERDVMELSLKLARPALFAAAATMCCLLGNSAAVADGVRRPAAPIVQQAPTSWSGFLLGANAGWSWSDF